MDRVACRYKNPRHLLRRTPGRASESAAHIRLLPARVGAYDSESAAGGELFVADTRGNNDHVTRVERDSDAILTAEPSIKSSARLFLTFAAATIMVGYGVSGAFAFWLSLAIRM